MSGCNVEDGCPGCISDKYVDDMIEAGADTPDAILEIFLDSIRSRFPEEQVFVEIPAGETMLH